MPSVKPFELGVIAAVEGHQAADCPYRGGPKRNEWLIGFFVAKPDFGVFVIGHFAC